MSAACETDPVRLAADAAGISRRTTDNRLAPTTENLCKALYTVLKDSIPAGKLEYVRVEETENNFFQYFGEEPNVTNRAVGISKD